MLNAIGIICEYNPFHNGHLIHLNYIKKNYPNHVIVLILSGFFTQRGGFSVLSKKDKVLIALEAGVDLVIELPFVFSTQSADIFATGAITILDNLKVQKLIFGSECNDINLLKKYAEIQNTKEFNTLVKKYEKEGYNYPTSLSKAFKDTLGSEINNPNDLLAISYIRAINNLKSNIEPISIQRTNDYHSLDTNSSIISASAIRNLLKENKKIDKYVPSYVLKYKTFSDPDIFQILKFKMISEKEFLNQFQTVDEGIENRIFKYLDKCKTLDELINNIKTKRYTYNRLKRMFIHILCSFTKHEANMFKDPEYIRILGFNKRGTNYLNQIKKEVELPIISKFAPTNNMLKLEQRITNIYANITNSNYLNEEEYKDFPINFE